jgi:hypothetical protein
MATDPTGGVGYGFGAQLPSAHMTTIATQQPDLVDSATGGTWPGNHIWTGNHTFNGQLAGTSTGGTLDISATALTIGATDLDGLLDMNAATSGIAYRTATVLDADSNLSVAVDEYRIAATLGADRTYTLLDASAPVPVDGQRIKVFRTFVLGGAAIFRRETGGEIARIPANTDGMVEFTFHSAGNGWYLTDMGGGATLTVHT